MLTTRGHNQQINKIAWFKVLRGGGIPVEAALDELQALWGEKYPIVIKSWRSKWQYLSAYFKYREDIRRIIYTTNSIEAPYRESRKLTKTKGRFPNNDSLLKLFFVGIRNALTNHMDQAALDVTLAYHQRSKHLPFRFAPSLGYMDWGTQPDPFRRFDGTHSFPLGFEAVGPLPRYAPLVHALELRVELPQEVWRAVSAQLPKNALLVGLTSIHWRESWKYGERAFRYCHHDVGHAIACISVAAAGLGWDARLLDGVVSECLGTLLGIHIQTGVEAENPNCLIAVFPQNSSLEAEMQHSFRFTMGGAVDDPRLRTHPPYQHLVRDARASETSMEL